MEKVNRETAEAEVNRWLAAIRFRESKREKSGYVEGIDILIEGVQSGELVVDENGAMTQILGEPLDGRAELKFANRITVGELLKRKQGSNDNSGPGQLMATAAAMTGTPIGIIGAMDSRDFDLTGAVAIFFM